jgi:hypothetical protein
VLDLCCFQVLEYHPEVSIDKLQEVLMDVISAMDVNYCCFLGKYGTLQVHLQALAVARFAIDHADPIHRSRPSVFRGSIHVGNINGCEQMYQNSGASGDSGDCHP